MILRCAALRNASVLISPRAVQDIRWTEHLIHLHVDRQKVQESPSFDPAKQLDHAHEDRMAGHCANALVEARPDEKAVESGTKRTLPLHRLCTGHASTRSYPRRPA
jgi:hypothetical protein